MEDDPMQLPPGFRFHPTDEELITHYLSPKAADHGFSARAVGEVDLNKCEPWDLPSKAKMGEKEWYFFCQRDRKYPTGTRTNRATEAGFWKATGKDKEIFKGTGILVGMKKTLVFYRGRAPRGEKTNWVMHEYRLDGCAFLPHLPRSAKEEWVVCRVLHKDAGGNGLSVEAATASTSSLRPGLIYPSYDSTAAAMRPSPSNRSGYYEIPPAAAGGNFSVLLGLENSSPVFFPQQAAAHPPPPPQPQLQRTNYYLSYLNNNVVEQCPSQETGLSTDRNTAEIESSLDEPASSAGPVYHLDLEDIWKY